MHETHGKMTADAPDIAALAMERRLEHHETSMDQPELSIIIPAFNEEATIEECVRGILAVYPRTAEVLVVDGGSDRTRQIVERMAQSQPAVRYIHNDNDRGKGHAVRRGISEARAPIMAQLCADLQWEPEDLPRLFAPLLEGKADVTLGSRFMKGSRRLDKTASWRRNLGNFVASLYASILVRHRMTDVLAGIKAWTAEAAQAIQLRTDGFSYEVEVPMMAVRKGLRVVDVPVATRDRAGGESKVSFLADGLRILLDITRFRLRSR